MMNDKSIILIKEWQQNIAELILFAVESNFNLRGVICNDMHTFRDWLKRPEVQGAIVSSSPASYDDAVEVFNIFSQQDKPSLFISLEEDVSIDWKKHNLPKPDAIIKRKKCINELVEVFEQQFTRQGDTPLDKYTRISMSPLVYFENIDEDIFIKLKSGRYLRLFREGDNVTTADIQKYQSKGLQELYILRDAYIWILSKIDSRLEQMIANPEMKLDMAEIKATPINDMDLIHIDGPVELEEEFLQYLHTKSEQMVKGMMKSKNLSGYFKNLKINRADSDYLTTRISIVSNIACGIIQKLEWGQATTYEKLLYVIHTHDIALMPTPELMRFQTVNELEISGNITEEQRQIFLAHPEKSVEIVSEDPFAPADVESIIIQHHEFPSREGFPFQLSSSKMQPLTAILIISLDFAERIIRSEKTPPILHLRKMKNKYKSATFVKIIKVLEELLDPTAKQAV